MQTLSTKFHYDMYIHVYNLPVAILALSVKGPTTIKFALTGGLPIKSFPNNSPIVSSTYSSYVNTLAKRVRD